MSKSLKKLSAKTRNNSQTHVILGIGTPILDQLIPIPESYLKKISGSKGGAEPVDYDTLLAIIESTHQQPICIAGGSAANTIKGLKNLGRDCRFFGKIGQDAMGELFSTELKQLNIDSHLQKTALPTAQAVCLVTPDHDRTMRYFLGAGSTISAEDLHENLFEGITFVHIEGYLIAQDQLIERALALANKVNAKISLDISSVETAEVFQNRLIKILPYVDIVFANELEAEALTQQSAKTSCKMLSDLAGVAVVKMGEQGSWVGFKEGLIHCPSIPVKVKDTTGAGDLFASGFLDGYLNNMSLQECAYCGTLLASYVIQVMGAEIPQDFWPEIRSLL